MISPFRWLRYFWPDYTWYVPSAEPVVYLTFDDGPVPGPTDFVLDALRDYGAQATFFCVGENVDRSPALMARALAEGHALGNHTYHHLKGWQTPTKAYLQDVAACARALTTAGVPARPAPLFRPPYGRFRRAQARALKNYQVVMWDVLPADYDQRLAPRACLRRAIRHTRPGSVVVLHDSYKAERNLRYVLPRYLRYFSQRGYRFAAL